uniref:Uncharacterized protein n=1 Tax=Strigamia maritima TaxID=126957 RepID=T1IKL3_STRMM
MFATVMFPASTGLHHVFDIAIQRLCVNKGCTTFSISPKNSQSGVRWGHDLIACSCMPVHGRFTGHVPTLLSEMYNLAVRRKLPSAIKLVNGNLLDIIFDHPSNLKLLMAFMLKPRSKVKRPSECTAVKSDEFEPRSEYIAVATATGYPPFAHPVASFSVPILCQLNPKSVIGRAPGGRQGVGSSITDANVLL